MSCTTIPTCLVLRIMPGSLQDSAEPSEIAFLRLRPWWMFSSGILWVTIWAVSVFTRGPSGFLGVRKLRKSLPPTHPLRSRAGKAIDI